MSGWLLVAADFTPLGGMDKANHALAKHLTRLGPVHLVTHRTWPDLKNHSNVTVHHVPRPFGRHLLGSPLLGRSGRAWAMRLSREGFRVVVNGGNCRWGDINWVHYVHATYTPAASTTKRTPRISTRINHALALRDERAVLKARVVVCNSHRTARDLVECLGINPDRVRVIYLSADTEKFAPITLDQRAAMRSKLGWQSQPWVSFVGALGDARKGFDTLYAAWRMLCHDRSWDANLAVAGAGSELQAWRSRAAADGLSKRIQFLGFREDLPDILAACDAVIHPARYDAYGLAVHEALCRGLPALVSLASGISERYPPELADLLIPDPDDSAELADRLRGWRRHLDSWRDRLTPFADSLRAYTWDNMAEDFVKTVVE